MQAIELEFALAHIRVIRVEPSWHFSADDLKEFGAIQDTFLMGQIEVDGRVKDIAPRFKAKEIEILACVIDVEISISDD